VRRFVANSFSSFLHSISIDKPGYLRAAALSLSDKMLALRRADSAWALPS
jgi:hypothetical protein